MRTYRVLTLFLALALALAACNLPTANETPTINANAVFTAAAQTVVVKLTENAAAIPSATLPPPSSTPPPAAPVATLPPPPVIVTATSAPVVLPTSACDAAQFVSDVTVADGTGYTGGATFTKTWRLKNAGTCTWNSSYALAFDSGDQMGGPASQPLSSSVAPGASVDISVNLQAPSADGSYTGVWGLKNPSGVRFPVIGGISARSFTVVIKVGSGISSGTSVPTVDGGATPSKLAVTNVAFHTIIHTGDCTTGKYTINIDITANRSGTVTYVWKRSDGGIDSAGSHTLTFGSAGTQTITYEWTGAAAGYWVGVYIDTPNHQMFQGPTLACS